MKLFILGGLAGLAIMLIVSRIQNTLKVRNCKCGGKGNPQLRHASRLRRDEGWKWLVKNYASLPQNEWVAANAEGLVASHATREGLFALIKEKQLSHHDLAITHNPNRPEPSQGLSPPDQTDPKAPPS